MVRKILVKSLSLSKHQPLLWWMRKTYSKQSSTTQTICQIQWISSKHLHYLKMIKTCTLKQSWVLRKQNWNWSESRLQWCLRTDLKGLIMDPVQRHYFQKCEDSMRIHQLLKLFQRTAFIVCMPLINILWIS